MLVFSDGYSKLEARGQDFQKLVFCKKKVFDLVFPFFFPKSSCLKKKRSSLRIEQFVFTTFRSNLIIISKKTSAAKWNYMRYFQEGPEATASLASPNIHHCSY